MGLLQGTSPRSDVRRVSDARVTPDEVVAVATVAAVIVSALFGISGFVVGMVGLHHAKKAKEWRHTRQVCSDEGFLEFQRLRLVLRLMLD